MAFTLAEFKDYDKASFIVSSNAVFMLQFALSQPALNKAQISSKIKEHQLFLRHGGAGGSFRRTLRKEYPVNYYSKKSTKGKQFEIWMRSLDASVSFVDCTLICANFTGSILHKCLFNCSVFDGSVFSDTQMNLCELEDASFKNVDFSNSDLSGSSFRGSDLSFASFENSNLTGVDFRGANIDQASFRSATLDGIIR